MLNAIVTLAEERARTEAREADAALGRGEACGPLHGVPITIKDTLATAGLRTTAGFPPLADYVPTADATVVARVRAAGAIILGKTNVPVLAADGQCNNPIFGRTNNPWDPTRTPGGSTGGGAAALAAGMAPLELGSDIAGSVRIPAHYCGVYGLKPTDHRVPITGHIPGLPDGPRGVRHMNVIGPLARSVEDLDLALRIIVGPDQSDWEVPPVPLDPARPRDIRELRLAWTDDFGGLSVSGETRTALAAFAAELDRLGCRVEQQSPEGFDFTRDALITALERFFESWDALLCPVTVGPAFPHCLSDTPIEVDGRRLHYDTALLGYTCPFNVSGHPAVVLPLARSATGLPIGLQVVGRRWGDMELLATAATLAQTLPPFKAPPGYAAHSPARAAM